MKKFLIIVVASIAPARRHRAAAQAQDADGVWSVAPPGALRADSVRALINGPQMVVTLNRAALDARLALAPREDAAGRIAGGEIEMCAADAGGRVRTLSASPSRRSWRPSSRPSFLSSRPTSDEASTIRRRRRGSTGPQPDSTRSCCASAGTVLIDPEVRGELGAVRGVSKDRRLAECSVDLSDGRANRRRCLLRRSITFRSPTARRNGTYRLALAATGEYTAAAGGAKSAHCRV